MASLALVMPVSGGWWSRDQDIGAPPPVDAHFAGPASPGLFATCNRKSGCPEGEVTRLQFSVVPDVGATLWAPACTPSPSKAPHVIATQSQSLSRIWCTSPLHDSVEIWDEGALCTNSSYAEDVRRMYTDKAQHYNEDCKVPKHEDRYEDLAWLVEESGGVLSEPEDEDEDSERLAENARAAGAACTGQLEDNDGHSTSDTTTMMVQNIPRRAQREDLLAKLLEHGFAGKFDYCYLPRSFHSSTNKGYAFVNFVDFETAQMFRQAWHLSFKLGPEQRPHPKPLRVTVAAVQGRCNNLRVASSKKISRIRNASCRPLVL